MDYKDFEPHILPRLQEGGEVKGPDPDGEYKCLCPYPNHNDTDASFSINPTKGVYHCFGCGQGGSINRLCVDVGWPEPDGRYKGGIKPKQKSLAEIAAERKATTPSTTEKPDIRTATIGGAPSTSDANKEKPTTPVGKSAVTVPKPTTKPKPPTNKKKAGDLKDGETFYLYPKANGDPNLRVRRQEADGKKGFIQEHYDNGGWYYGGKEGEKVLYNLPEITASNKSTPVFVVEGEKDADRLMSEDLLATTNLSGAGKWESAYNETLKGRPVYIIPDNDDTGLRHAENVKMKLAMAGCKVKILVLPDLPDKGDVSDWLDDGKTIVDLNEIMDETPWYDPDMEPWVDPWGSPLTLTDAHAERPPLEYLVDGLITKGSLNILYGAPGTMKSMLALDMGVCVAMGKTWLQGTPNAIAPVPKETIKGNVLWIDLDNGSRRTLDRAKAISKGHETPKDAGLLFYSMPDPWFNASLDDHVDDLRRRIKWESIDLLIIDNLSRIRGNIDENSADMDKIMGAFRKLIDATGCAVIIIHHVNKSDGSTRKGDRLRGHSSIEGALDLALQIHREERAEEVTIISTKTRDVDVDNFGAKFSFTHKDDTYELDTALFYGDVVEHTGGEDELMDTIILVLEDSSEGLNQQQMVERVQERTNEFGKRRIRKKLEVMANGGAIKMEVDRFAKNQKIYSIGP